MHATGRAAWIRSDAALKAARDGRTAALTLTDLPPEPPVFQDAQAVQQHPALQPHLCAPDADALTDWADSLTGQFDASGCRMDWPATAAPLLAALGSRHRHRL
jgi:hypothetical protein